MFARKRRADLKSRSARWVRQIPLSGPAACLPISVLDGIGRTLLSILVWCDVIAISVCGVIVGCCGPTSIVGSASPRRYGAIGALRMRCIGFTMSRYTRTRVERVNDTW